VEKKGLCDTCDNDKGCTFRSRLPVLQCEEFTNANNKLTKTRQISHKKSKCLEEVAAEE